MTKQEIVQFLHTLATSDVKVQTSLLNLLKQANLPNDIKEVLTKYDFVAKTQNVVDSHKLARETDISYTQAKDDLAKAVLQAIKELFPSICEENHEVSLEDFCKETCKDEQYPVMHSSK